MGSLPIVQNGSIVNLGLVVSTLGRIDPLRRLLDSIDGELAPGDRVVIVAQERVAEVEALARTYVERGIDLIVTTSERGASLGRNVGVAALGDGERLLTFPNDTTWYPAGVLARLRTHADTIQAGALTIRDELGPKFSLPPAGTRLDRWNVWSVIEMGIVMRKSVFDRLGGFDPSIGTGAASPWQAGEATDLLLRLIVTDAALACGFVWLPPEVSAGGIADAHGLNRTARRHKLRAYGRGLGRVVTRWRYPAWWRFAFVVGGLAFGLRHRPDYELLDGWWVFLGRLEGAVGRPLGRAVRTEAVSR